MPEFDVYCYGANEAGVHGRGSAREALKNYGATWGKFGYSGNSYGIPTKDSNLQVLPITTIQRHVDDFVEFAESRPDLKFFVVKIGCGLAGFTEDQMAPLFKKAPENCILPYGWIS